MNEMERARERIEALKRELEEARAELVAAHERRYGKYKKYGGSLPAARTRIPHNGVDETEFVPPRTVPTPCIPDANPWDTRGKARAWRMPMLGTLGGKDGYDYRARWAFAGNDEDVAAWQALGAARTVTKSYDLLDAWRTVLLSVYRMRLGLGPVEFYVGGGLTGYANAQREVARENALERTSPPGVMKR